MYSGNIPRPCRVDSFHMDGALLLCSCEWTYPYSVVPPLSRASTAAAWAALSSGQPFICSTMDGSEFWMWTLSSPVLRQALMIFLICSEFTALTPVHVCRLSLLMTSPLLGKPSSRARGIRVAIPSGTFWMMASASPSSAMIWNL
ncbi:hypothetical protein EYF80_049769 [Liparis tanakae]|uniref:Uncharacterized protein n=1 Tax=Liparis tanakae TaxID=230148 RepID=A0A4Z2FH25_9TELE|nr:hypothetical protein EYF80_049769 [Liparis tanakae]